MKQETRLSWTEEELVEEEQRQGKEEAGKSLTKGGRGED